MSERRHTMMFGKDESWLDDPKYLRYWWNGEDEPHPHTVQGEGYWEDRINKVKMYFGNMNRFKNPGYEEPSGHWAELWSVFDLGHHFRIVFDAMVTVNTGSMDQLICFLDFGAYVNNDRFLCGISYKDKCPWTNYKMSNIVSGRFADNIVPYDKGSVLDGIFEYGIEKFDDENDVLTFAHNGKKHYGAIVKPTNHVIPNPTSGIYRLNSLGTGTRNPDTNENFSQDILYRDIKIYVYD